MAFAHAENMNAIIVKPMRISMAALKDNIGHLKGYI